MTAGRALGRVPIDQWAGGWPPALIAVVVALGLAGVAPGQHTDRTTTAKLRVRQPGEPR